MRLLHELGYTNVRHYRGGLADWKDSGGLIKSASPSGAQAPWGRELRARGGAYVAPEFRANRFENALLGLIERCSTSELSLVWLAIILLSGVAYWIAALVGRPALIEHGAAVAGRLDGLATAVYFSFVTATSIGYGDVLPVGMARVLAVVETVGSLMIFGAVIAKFVSRRQEQLVSEIHRVTFEERLDRVQTNLHLVLSELHAISAMCESRSVPHNRLASRLESALRVFAGELGTVHDLLYRPEREPDEPRLRAILAGLAAALEELKEMLSRLPAELGVSPILRAILARISSLAREICGECVPRSYAPALTVWMDRIQALARDLS